MAVQRGEAAAALPPHLILLLLKRETRLPRAESGRYSYRMPAKLQYCVYILLSLHDGDLYVGYTSDLQRRLTEHFHVNPKPPLHVVPSG